MTEMQAQQTLSPQDLLSTLAASPSTQAPGSKDPAREESRAIDDALIRRCARQDPRALEELTRRYQAPLYRCIRRQVQSEQDAEDIVVEVFVRVWRYAHRFRLDASVQTWLYRIALNLVRDAHRRSKARLNPSSLEDCHEAARLSVASAEHVGLAKMEAEELSQALRRALERLSETDRAILSMYYMEDRSYEEIMAIVGVSCTVLKMRLSRARKRLWTALQPAP